jgi:beta-ketoacyl synthase-like protein
MSVLRARLLALAVRGPGLPDWPATEAVLRGDQPYVPGETLLPAPETLPPTERRRAGRVVRLAMAAGLELTRRAGRDAATLPVVFASSGGDGDNCDAICRTLASDSRALSPTRFHNSVHNAPAGYWSIAAGAQAPTTTVCAFDASFGAGLLEALGQVEATAAEVALIAYDLDYPPPLHAVRPTGAPFAVALLLAPERGTGPALARLGARLGDGRADALAEPALERLRRANPAAQGLVLCAAVARRVATTVHVAYFEPSTLALEVAPCG